MAESLSPGEARAEAYRQKAKNLGGQAMTTMELLEAADAVSKAAELALKADKKFIQKVEKESGKTSEKSG